MAAPRRRPIVVFTSGTFDLFHVGHVNIFKRSRALGDRLVVGVSTDELIASYKGVPPVVPFKERLRMVASCRYVDQVVKQTVLTDVRQLRRYKVDTVTIGSDWKGKYLYGLEWMKRHGKVVYLEYTKGVSTTDVKRKIIQSCYELIHAEAKRSLEAQLRDDQRREQAWPRIRLRVPRGKRLSVSISSPGSTLGRFVVEDINYTGIRIRKTSGEAAFAPGDDVRVSLRLGELRCSVVGSVRHTDGTATGIFFPRSLRMGKVEPSDALRRLVDIVTVGAEVT